MKLRNIEKVVVLGTCGILFGAVNVHCMGTGGQKGNVVVSLDGASKQTRGKKLICPEMGMLNALLEVAPISIMKMHLAYSATRKVSQEMRTKATSDEKLVAVQIKSILDPVKEFLNYAHEYAYIVRPLVIESLLGSSFAVGSGATTAASTATTEPIKSLDQNSSLILKFLESKDGTDAFFDKNVRSREQLMGVCQEFTIFFEDILASLSERATQAHKANLEKIKGNQKRPASQL